MLLSDNQTKLVADFQFIFTAIATLGQDMDSLIDCSDVIPAPAPQNFGDTMFPAGKSLADVEPAVSSCLSELSGLADRFPSSQCAATPFPSLATAPGPETSVASMYVSFLAIHFNLCLLHTLQPPSSRCLNGNLNIRVVLRWFYLQVYGYSMYLSMCSHCYVFLRLVQ